MSPNHETSIQYLKGVGEKRAALYHKLGIDTVRDLLYHFPRDYIDLSRPHRVMDAPLYEQCAVRAVLCVKGREQRIRKGLSLFKLRAEDESGLLEVTVFNSKYTVDALKLGEEYIFYGKLGGSMLRREMSAPEIYPAAGNQRVLPVYPQTAGLSSRVMRANMLQALDQAAPPPDPVPVALRERLGLPPLAEALLAVHFPQSVEEAHRARNRFVFEELLVLGCALSCLHADSQAEPVPPMSREAADMPAFYHSLPFELTGAQRRCIDEAIADLTGDRPMNRLIQGDVGSGKTAVAVACAYFAARNGGQTAVMVPTEILAEQHHRTMSRMFEPFGIGCALLTGHTKAAARREVLAGLLDGSVGLCVGTHALLTEGVEFQNLALVVTDEQHRFGVKQRAKLSGKSRGTHVLVMSATPIPRTLSLIIYGDLRLSLLDEMPAGRRPVRTLVIDSSKRARAMGFIRDALDAGRQAYIVCPLIEQGEIDTGLKPAAEYAEALRAGELKGYRVGLLHGRMKSAEKEETMRAFTAGEIQALVSTTVVEVGVDVPNATIILIENAERFGLSQLHQLRGRVGRGSEQSWCILLSDARGETARERLRTMKSTDDGFAIAERDLQLRGPGDFFGYRQHGLPALKVANLADDLAVMSRAQQCAEQLLAADPALGAPEHRHLRAATDAMIRSVGERPN